MTGIKRVTPGAEEEKNPLSNVELTEAEAKILEDVQERIGRVELALQLEEIKRFGPVYADRREVVKSISKFWPVALMHTPSFAVYCQHASDIQALSYLEDLWVERDLKEPRAFVLEFTFKENPYFSDKVLKKAYTWVPWSEADNTPDENGISKANLEFEWSRDIKISATKISWKDPQQALTKLYPRQQDEPDEFPADNGSFFNWFENDQDPFEIGVSIAQDFFPEAIESFLNPDHDEIDSEDEEDEDDDEEIDLEKPRTKKQKI